MHSAEPDSNIRTVPITLNGTTRHMILDTGGAITQPSHETIEELQLPLYDSGTAVYAINGRGSRRFAVVDEFTFGHLNRKAAALMVWPEPRRPYAGELAQDMLQPYDVDVDFGAGLLRMYAKDHCPGPQDWTPTVRTTMQKKRWNLHIPVTLDGHTYDAIIDTGSRHTIMRLPAARRDFDLHPDSPSMTPYRAINGDAFLTGYLHNFSKMSFGGMTVDNPEVIVVPDIMSRNADKSPMARNRTYNHNADLILPELSLGMDVLKHLHLFMAFGEQALYIAPDIAVPGAPPHLGKP
ncbi:MAG: pepsin/retropepsin-like aspartic protease family protein [Alphaproteobacteria bacterium]|nr:pepsin/retropepsin-like aspartic protease family protein [Alphaproteobacteria bacterium]